MRTPTAGRRVGLRGLQTVDSGAPETDRTERTWVRVYPLHSSFSTNLLVPIVFLKINTVMYHTRLIFTSQSDDGRDRPRVLHML